MKEVPMSAVINMEHNNFQRVMGKTEPVVCRKDLGPTERCSFLQVARGVFGNERLVCPNKFYIVRRIGSMIRDTHAVCALFVKNNIGALEKHKKLGIGNMIDNKGEDG